MFYLGQRRGATPVQLIERAALLLGLGERLFEGALKRAGDEPVLGLAGVELAAPSLRLELGTLECERLQPPALGVLGLELVNGRGGSRRPRPG